MSESRRVTTGWLGSRALVYALLLLAPLTLLSGCGSGQTGSGQSNSVPVNLAVSFPQNSASTASASTIGDRVWAVVQSWLPTVSSAWAVGTVTNIASLTVEVSAPDLPAPITRTVALSTPISGQVVTLSLDIPVGANRVFTVSCLDATRVRLFKGNSSPVTLSGGQAAMVDIALAAAGIASPLASIRGGHTATLLKNGQVLVVGGTDRDGLVTFSLASVELFDPATKTWSSVASLTEARYFHTATLLPNGQVLVVGGFGAEGALASAELFDPATKTWSPVAGLTTARDSHTATLLQNGQVLVAGGFGGPEALVSAELFDPATKTWSPVASLTTARGNHTATLLQNRQVLVVGGFVLGGNLASAEVFDPVTKAWSPVDDLTDGRALHTATLLQNGQVLVAGGFGAAGAGSLASAELFDPVTKTWSPVANLTTARDNHTATLLQTGQVLVVGGFVLNGNVASAELFNPATNQWSTLATGLTDARDGHTATLIQDEQVIVVGGYVGLLGNNAFLGSGGAIFAPNGFLASAELYDLSLL